MLGFQAATGEISPPQKGITVRRAPRPAAAKDRLYLVSASGFLEYREVYDALSRMGFYNLNPDRIGELRDPHVGDLLERD
ncbi:MAG: hypothetical protein ACPL88_07415, partial [Bryobacteraceae bacterium]